MLTHQVKDDVTTLQGVLWVNQRIIIGGGLEHTNQDGCVLGRQILRFAVKIGLTSRFDTKGVRTEIDGIGILCQNLVFGEEEFQFIGCDPFLTLHNEHLHPWDIAQQTRRVF